MAIFTAIATSIVGAAFAATTLGSFVVSGISAALAAGASYLLSKYTNRQKKRRYSAFKSDREYGGDVPRQGHFGITASKGHFVRYFKWGAGNKYNADVIVLSDGWCDGLEPYIILNGEKLDLVSKAVLGGEKEHWAIDDYDGLTSIRYYDGDPAQIADAKLIADTGGSISTDPVNNVSGAWNGTDIGANMAYIIFEMEYSSVWESVPDVTFVHRGLKVYDPRLDLSQSGTHDPTDPATWDYTDNPAAQRTTYLLGAVSGLVSGRAIIGMGKPVSHIDINSHIVAANVSDEARVVGGNSVKKYHCNIIAEGQDDHSELLKEFDDAMAGYGVNRGGLASIVVGAPQLPVLEITEDDILAEAPVNVQYRKSSANLYNIFTGQFLSPEALYTPTSMTPVSVNSDIAADKHKNQIAYNFMQVLDPAIAQYLLNIRYRQNRKGATASFQVFDKIAIKLNAGDWITWREQTWMVSNKKGAALQFVAVGADTYSEEGIDAGAVVIPPSIVQNPSITSTVQNFNAAAGAVQGEGANQTPVLRFTWTPPDDPTITDVLIKYYDITNSGEVFTVLTGAPEVGKFTTSENIESNRVYNAWATIRTAPARYITDTALVTTAATPRKSRAVTLAEMTAEVNEAREFATVEIRDFKERLMQLSHDLAQTTMHQLKKLDDLEVKAGGARASITQTRKVAVTNNLALAENIINVQSSVDDVASDVFTLNRTVVTNEQATATAITDLTAAVDDVSFAEGRLTFEVVAAPTGVTSRIAAVAKATDDDDTAQALFFMDATVVAGVTESKILFVADKFSFTDGTHVDNGMTFENGVLRLDVADIGTITTGVIDLQNGYIIS